MMYEPCTGAMEEVCCCCRLPAVVKVNTCSTKKSRNGSLTFLHIFTGNCDSNCRWIKTKLKCSFLEKWKLKVYLSLTKVHNEVHYRYKDIYNRCELPSYTACLKLCILEIKSLILFPLSCQVYNCSNCLALRWAWDRAHRFVLAARCCHDSSRLEFWTPWVQLNKLKGCKFKLTRLYWERSIL